VVVNGNGNDNDNGGGLEEDNAMNPMDGAQSNGQSVDNGMNAESARREGDGHGLAVQSGDEGNGQGHNAMDVDGDDDPQQEEQREAAVPHAQPQADGMGMEVELSQRTEQSNSVGPTVVNAFPTTMSADNTAVEREQDEEEHMNGDGQFEFGSATEREDHSNDRVLDEQDDGAHGHGQEEDGDVEMGGDGVEAAPQREDDVLGDIANAVESNVDVDSAPTAPLSTSMPVLESSTTDADNEEKGNEDEVTDHDVAVETEPAPQSAIIPTMPEVQREDNATDSAQSAVNNDDAETPDGTGDGGQTLTPQKAMTPQKINEVEEKGLENMDPAHGLNVMEAAQQDEQRGMGAVGQHGDGGDGDEDEDVDTPLADEIDF